MAVILITQRVTRCAVLLLVLLPACRCTVTQLPYAMLEEKPAGWIVADLALAVQGRYQRSDKLEFALLPQNGDWRNYFVIDKDSTLLKIKTPLDRDVLAPNADNYVITLQVALVSPDFEPFRVQISLDDVNDNTPTFPDARFVLAVSESSPVGKSFPLPLAVDPDSPPYAVNEYRLLSNSSLFTLREVRTDGQLEGVRLELRHSLDRETMPRTSVRVLAVDGGSPRRTGTLTVDIVVTDSNDHSPAFDSDVYEVTIAEDTPPDTVIVTVHATDRDEGVNARLSYALSALTHKQYGHMFAINNDTGEMSLLTRLRYDVQNSFTLSVDVRDLGVESLSGRTKVIVNVVDVNDHAPEITLNPWGTGDKVEVTEEEPSGTFVAFVYVDDKDSGVNGDVSCVLDTTLFVLSKVDARYYKVLTSFAFDREIKDKYDVRITCTDRGTPSKSTTKDFSVKINDANDNTPVFEQDVYTVTIPENVTGIDVITVKATDGDLGANARITYHISGHMAQYFTIDSVTGRVRVKAGLDYEKMHSVNLHVYASDDGKPRHSSTSLIVIDLTDVNDEAPVFSRSQYTFPVREGGAEGATVGHVNATDRDSSRFNTFLYSLKDDMNSTFAIKPLTGQITAKRALDRERQATYRLTIIASDLSEPKWNTSVDVILNVEDVNDNAPDLYVITDNNDSVIQVPARARMGYQVTEVRVKDADVGNNAVHTFSLSEDHTVDEGYFRIHPFNGVVSLDRDVAPLSGRTLRLNVSVQDGGAVPLRDTLQLTVVINSSMWYEPLERSNNGRPSSAASFLGSLRYHEMIIVLLTAVTAVLVTVLVTAIICLKVKQQRRQFDKTHRYNCRQYDHDVDVGVTDDYSTLQHGAAAGKKMMTYESRDADTMETYPMMRPPVTNGFHNDVPLVVSIPANSPHSQLCLGGVTSQTCHWQHPLQSHSQAGHHLLSPPEKAVALAAEDSDSVASATSVNDSNTDSGRGGSEEGGEGARGRGAAVGEAASGAQHVLPQAAARPVISSFLPRTAGQAKTSMLLAHEQALHSLPRLSEHSPLHDAAIMAAGTQPATPSEYTGHVYPARSGGQSNGQRMDDNRGTLERRAAEYHRVVPPPAGYDQSTSDRAAPPSTKAKYANTGGPSLKIVNV